MSAGESRRLIAVTFVADDAGAALQRVVLSSLPARYHIVSDEPADVLVIPARPWDWPRDAAAAIDSGCRAVVVCGRALAAPGDVAAVSERAELAGVALVSLTPFATTRSWRDVLPSVLADAATAAVIDSLVTWPADEGGDLESLASAMLDQLAMVSPLIDDPGSLRWLRRTTDSFQLEGAPGRASVTLAGVRSPAGTRSLTVRLAGQTARWHVRADASSLASPVEAIRFDIDGSHAWPPVYESGYRAAWSSLYAVLTGSETHAPLPVVTVEEMSAVHGLVSRVPMEPRR